MADATRNEGSMRSSPKSRAERITVVIPCFNQANFIEQCVESVLAQSVAPEIIVVDDGSTDGSTAILDKYNSRVRLITQANGGPSVARNTGFAASTGSLVCFLDGDDMLSPDFIAAVSDCSIANPSADVFVGSWRTLALDGSLGPLLSPVVAHADPFHSWLRRGWGPPMCFTMRRETLLAAGAFDPDRRIMGNEDWDMWIRVAATRPRYQECYAATAVYRMATGSVSSNAARQWLSRRLVIAKALGHHGPCLKCRLAAIANGPNYVEFVIFPRIADYSWRRLVSLALGSPSISVPLARALARRLASRARVKLGKLRRHLNDSGT